MSTTVYNVSMPKSYITKWIDGKQYRLHRLIMETYLDRELSSDEIVHHKNGNIHDNRLENLEMMTRAEHKLKHDEIGMETRLKKVYFFTKEELQRLREKGLSSNKIALIYKCAQPTVWRACKKFGISLRKYGN